MCVDLLYLVRLRFEISLPTTSGHHSALGYHICLTARAGKPWLQRKLQASRLGDT